MRQFLPLMALVLLACNDTTGFEEETVNITLRLELAGDRDVGPASARVYVFSDAAVMNRGFAIPQLGESCVFSTTPVTTCEIQLPRRRFLTFVATEPDPAVVERFEPESPDDSLRDGRYVEFIGWNECEDAVERGVCAVRPRTNLTITARFQLLQQVTFYQTGVAAMDYRMFTTGPTLKVPAQNDNILDLAGCRGFPFAGCDSVRLVGDQAYHRFTAYVPRRTIVAMYSEPGAQTEIMGWDGPCIASTEFGPGVCSLISPDVSGPPIKVYVHYTWWSCPSGISDRDSGFCSLRGERQVQTP